VLKNYPLGKRKVVKFVDLVSQLNNLYSVCLNLKYEKYPYNFSYKTGEMFIKEYLK